MKLKGKTAIITGTAGGIGRASAQLFVKEGAQVALFDIDEKGMKETAALIGDPANCVPLTTDISSEENVVRSVAEVVKRFGKIDILFSNAAFNRNFKPALETTYADWDAEHNVTLKGAFRVSRHVLPHMLKRESGSIVFTASIMGLVGLASMTAYCSAKGGLIQLARSLACDYSSRGIRVNVIAPGPIDTPVFDTVRDKADIVQAIVNKTLLKRMGKPEEVAKVALFLASDDASYITGSVVAVDGGSLAQLI